MESVRRHIAIRPEEARFEWALIYCNTLIQTEEDRRLLQVAARVRTSGLAASAGADAALPSRYAGDGALRDAQTVRCAQTPAQCSSCVSGPSSCAVCCGVKGVWCSSRPCCPTPRTSLSQLELGVISPPRALPSNLRPSPHLYCRPSPMLPPLPPPSASPRPPCRASTQIEP